MFLPLVPRVARDAFPHTALRYACTVLLRYHPSGVGAIKSFLAEIWRGAEVARRLAIFAVKKLSRFEREETRAVRSTANEVSSASFRVLARNGQF